MRSETLPRNAWKTGLDGFSRRHAGQCVTLLVLSQDGVPLTEARGQALMGVSLDPKGHEPGDIAVVVEGDAGHVERHVHRPVEIELVRADDGADCALSIRDDDGHVTVIRCTAGLFDG